MVRVAAPLVSSVAPVSALHYFRPTQKPSLNARLLAASVEPELKLGRLQVFREKLMTYCYQTGLSQPALARLLGYPTKVYHQKLNSNLISKGDDAKPESNPSPLSFFNQTSNQTSNAGATATISTDAGAAFTTDANIPNNSSQVSRRRRCEIKAVHSQVQNSVAATAGGANGVGSGASATPFTFFTIEEVITILGFLAQKQAFWTVAEQAELLAAAYPPPANISKNQWLSMWRNESRGKSNGNFRPSSNMANSATGMSENNATTATVNNDKKIAGCPTSNRAFPFSIASLSPAEPPDLLQASLFPSELEAPEELELGVVGGTNEKGLCNNDAFNKEVKKLLCEVGLTKKQLAELLAVSYSSLKYFLSDNPIKRKQTEGVRERGLVIRVLEVLVQKEAVTSLAEAHTLLKLAYPNHPRHHKFTPTELEQTWVRKLCLLEPKVNLGNVPPVAAIPASTVPKVSRVAVGVATAPQSKSEVVLTSAPSRGCSSGNSTSNTTAAVAIAPHILSSPKADSRSNVQAGFGLEDKSIPKPAERAATSSDFVGSAGVRAIPYRPELARLLGNVNSTILLQQIAYWWEWNSGSKPFYKFRAPGAKHALYKVGDSWLEELAFSPDEFDSALRRIATKIGVGDSKRAVLAQVQPEFDARGQLSNAKNLVLYWTKEHLTYYEINVPLYNAVMALLLPAPVVPQPQSHPQAQAPRQTTVVPVTGPATNPNPNPNPSTSTTSGSNCLKANWEKPNQVIQEINPSPNPKKVDSQLGKAKLTDWGIPNWIESEITSEKTDTIAAKDEANNNQYHNSSIKSKIEVDSRVSVGGVSTSFIRKTKQKLLITKKRPIPLNSLRGSTNGRATDFSAASEIAETVPNVVASNLVPVIGDATFTNNFKRQGITAGSSRSSRRGSSGVSNSETTKNPAAKTHSDSHSNFYGSASNGLLDINKNSNNTSAGLIGVAAGNTGTSTDIKSQVREVLSHAKAVFGLNGVAVGQLGLNLVGRTATSANVAVRSRGADDGGDDCYTNGQKPSPSLPIGLTERWVAAGLARYGRTKLQVALTLASEREAKHVHYVEGILARLTDAELTEFGLDGTRKPLAPVAAVSTKSNQRIKDAASGSGSAWARATVRDGQRQGRTDNRNRNPVAIAKWVKYLDSSATNHTTTSFLGRESVPFREQEQGQGRRKGQKQRRGATEFSTYYLPTKPQAPSGNPVDGSERPSASDGSMSDSLIMMSMGIATCSPKVDLALKLYLADVDPVSNRYIRRLEIVGDKLMVGFFGNVTPSKYELEERWLPAAKIFEPQLQEVILLGD